MTLRFTTASHQDRIMHYSLSINRSAVCLIGSALLASILTTTVFAAEPLVMQSMDHFVHGSDEIATGEYEKAILKSLAAVKRGGSTKSRITAATNLCIGYTLTKQYDKAATFCDRAVAFNQYEWITLNNRAVLNCVTRNYQASVDDLQKVIASGRGSWRAAPVNLRHVELELAAMKAYDTALAQTD